MAALHPLGALGTMADMHIDLCDDGANRTRNVCLILRLHVIFRDHATTVRTVLRQRRLDHPIHPLGFRTMRRAMTGFLSRFLRLGFGRAWRERGRLAFATPSRVIQLLFQLGDARFQLFNRRSLLAERGVRGG